MRITLFAIFAFAGAASAQGITTPHLPPFTQVPHYPPYPAPAILAPAYTPGYQPYSYYGIAGNVRIGSVMLGGNYFQPLPYYGSPFGTNVVASYQSFGTPSIVLPPPTPLPNLAPVSQLDKAIAEAEFEATLVLQFPAPAEVWLDGKRSDSSITQEVTLTSPSMKLGNSHTFRVRAEWELSNQRYAVERVITVKAGERSRLAVLSGDAIK